MADITINLDQLYGGEELFPDALVNAAAQLALKQWTAPGPDGEQSEVPTALGRRIEEEVQRVITEEARAAAPKVVERVLEEGVQRTNEYGSPRGGRVTVRDIVAQKVVEQLTRSTGRGQLGREKSVIDEMVEDEVKKQIRAELQGALDEAKEKIVAAVGGEATKALTDALARALPGVRV